MTQHTLNHCFQNIAYICKLKRFNFQNCKRIYRCKQKTGGSVFLHIWAKYLALTIRRQSQIKAPLSLRFKILLGQVKVSTQEHDFINYRKHTTNITMICFQNSLQLTCFCYVIWLAGKRNYLGLLFVVFLMR